jgi:tape measure domain-containing protein
MTTPVSEFYAKIGIDVDKKSLKGVDKFFSDLEKRLGGVGRPLTTKGGVVSGFKQLTKETQALTRAENNRSKARSIAVNKEIAENNRLARSRKRLAETGPVVVAQTVRGSRANPRQSAAQQRKSLMQSVPTADYINRTLGISSVRGGMSRNDRQKQYEQLFGLNSNLRRVSSRGSTNNLAGLSKLESQIKSGAYAKANKTEATAANAQLQAAKLQLQAANLAQRTQQIQARENIAKLNLDKIKERRLIENEKWARRQEAQLRREAARAARIKRGNYLAMVGAGGALARYGLASLPFVGGMYGLASLNRANQTLMSTEISSGAIFGNRADEAKNWLKQHSNYVGYNYLETMPIFSQFMASGMNTMGYEKSLGVFEGFSEFGRTRGADKLGMQRGLRAISQMQSKGKITSEELRLQLSEATGFGEAVPIFAEAWQILNGGELKGSDATAALFKAMEKGDVYSDKLLPIVGKLMKARASTGIDAARTSSIAEQARAENAQTALLGTFSQNGGEAGFARFWQTITWAMKELEPLVKGMAGLFERLSVIMQAPVRLFGMLGTAVGYLNQQFGWSEKNIVTFAALGTLMFSKWGRVAAMFTGLLIVLEDIAFGVMGKDSLTKRFMEWIEGITGFDVDRQKGIFALAGALMTAAVAMKAISSLKGVTDILSTGKTVPGGPQKGGGPKSSPLSVGKKAGLLAAASALFMDQQDVYSLTGGIGLNPALFQPINSLSLDSFPEGRDFKYTGLKSVSYSDVMAGINESTVPTPQDILGKMISGTTASNNVTVQNEFVINASDPQGVWQEIEGKIEYSVNKMLNDAYLESGG